MATRKKALSEADAPAGVMVARAAEQTFDDFADELGRILGRAQSKAESWLGQRKLIAARLIGVRNAANNLLTQLGVEPPVSRASRRNQDHATATSEKPRPRQRRTLSADGRARIAAAQRARWARERAGRK